MKIHKIMKITSNKLIGHQTGNSNGVLVAILLICSLLTVNCSDEPIPVDAKPIPLRAALLKRVQQDNAFAFDLLRNTISTTTETNVFISPLSVSIALGMTRNGAMGTTKAEMDSVLKIKDLSDDEINEYYKVMVGALPGIDPTTKLILANSIWLKIGFDVKPDFLRLNADNFGAYIKSLDFSKSWAVDTINNWCAAKTNNLIQKPLDQIPTDAMMYLMNTIYFKGTWRKQFDSKLTKEDDFTTDAGNMVKVNMMSLKDTFNYVIDSNAQYLDMPYGNKAFSMTVILPNEGKSVDNVLNSLNGDSWNAVLSGMHSQEVQVYFPRFKAQNKFLLNDALQNMGMKLAFSQFANFRQIADTNLCITRVLHDTYVEVTEKGTVAAAATVVEIGLTSIAMPTIFKVNKPFLFMIREKSTGVILFIGKMGAIDKF
jgi:serpin B